jgi:YHS domain-containing protein
MSRSEKRETFIDPVCGMTVNPITAAAQTCYNGIQIYFCAEGCRKAFDAAPEKFTVNRRKGFWRRYLDRLNKATGGRPPACH